MAYEKQKSENYALLGGINAKASPYQNGPTELRDITNMNFIEPGSLTKRPGSTLAVGATISGRITGGVEFERLNGASYIVVTANTNAYTATPNAYTAFKTGLLSGALFDFVTFVDRLFCANGQDFFKYDGSNSSNYSLPPGITGAWGVTAVVGGGLSGTFVASYGYLNDRGYYGPPSNGITISLNGITFGSIGYYGLTAPAGYGLSAISLYRSSPTASAQYGTTLAGAAATAVTDTGFPLTTQPGPQYLWFTLVPRFMEIYNNQLFMGGFSSLLSTAYWSDIGEPEGVDPTFSGEFRTNDGDRLTGFKSYGGALVVTKERSFHRVVGDNPSNFQFQEVSDQYGCLSNRALVVFEDRLWFLDPKGIVEYNGANTRVVSNKMEPTFLSMNVPAARDNAVAIHYRQLNEVWFGIPTNGATLNNTTVVYDYVADAWTKYEGFAPSSLFLAKGALAQQTTYFGGYTGNLFYFGSSLFGDNGAGITCFIQSRFQAPMGQTTEELYRRFYLDVSPVLGITQAISTNFLTNYSNAIAATRTMYQAPFQSRVDFGLPARAIAAQIYHVSASLSFCVKGYAFESRFQRAT